MEHISHSSIQLFIDCPRHWFAKYVDKLITPAGDAAAFGTGFDQAIAARVVPGSEVVACDPDVLNAVEFYLAQPRAWDRAQDAQVKIELDPDQWAVLAEYYGSCTEIPVPLVGYVDLVRTMEDGIRRELLDLKTSSRKEFRPSWSVQTMLYAAALRAARIGVHLLVRRANGSFDFAAYEHCPNHNDYRWVLNYVGFYANQLTEATKYACSDDLPAKPGYWCAWCPVKLECPGVYLGSMNNQIGG